MAHTIYHYTCEDSRQIIGEEGTLIPSRLTGVLWLTDLDAPIRSGLGLTSTSLDCDRTQHRYRVLVDEGLSLHDAGIYPWRDVRKGFDPAHVASLEACGALPMHWYVSDQPQRAVHDCGCQK